MWRRHISTHLRACWMRAAVILRHDRRHGNELAPLRGHHRTRQRADGAGVEAAAHEQPGRRRGAAQPALDRFGQDLAIGLDVVGFVATLMRRIGVRLPVTA